MRNFNNGGMNANRLGNNINNSSAHTGALRLRGNARQGAAMPVAPVVPYPGRR